MRVERARGARVNGLIDFTSGWLVANVGHDNRAVMRAVRKARGWAVLDRWDNPSRLAAEEALLSTLPDYMDFIALYNSGSEAIDAALRFACMEVTAHPRGFHGSTIGAQSIERAPFTSSDRRWAVLVETFLGPWCEWYSPEEIDALRAHQETGGLVIFDEMQSGFGRTGRWWGFEHYDIEPDMVVGGKAIAGGFPLAFVAGRSWMVNNEPIWESTFSGNALSSAACVATVEQIRSRRLIERVVELEPMIREAFPEAQGKGFAYAFRHPDADAVVDRALERGVLLLHTGRGTVKMAPPLTIRKRDLATGLRIIREVV